MSDLTDRLRNLYVQNGTNYVQEAADEIDRLRVTVKMLQDDRAALRETQAKFGQVQHDLLSQIDALREQLALAESVRAAQVAGLTEGLDALQRDTARWRTLVANSSYIDYPANDFGALVSPPFRRWYHDSTWETATFADAIDAALKGEAG
jgi:hypothetical protein